MQPLGGQFRTIQPPKADPAPTRLTMKVQRWVLSPAFRPFLRFVLPFGLCIVAGAGVVTNDHAMDRLQASVAEAQNIIATRPEYLLQSMAVTGASDIVKSEIAVALGISFPISGLNADLDAIVAKILTVPAVSHAHVSVKAGGILYITVKEISPAALWKTEEGYGHLSRDGVVLRVLPYGADMPADLPLISGEGAPDVLEDVWQIYAELQPIQTRVIGLQYVGQRRWDVVLTRNQKIALPEHDMLAALRQVLVLQDSVDILSRDVFVLDIRNPRRITVRLTPDAVAIVGASQFQRYERRP
ncbi:MAG: cell division protein FtsQ/DivIB [Pseudomonadota bacterium]